MHETQEQLFDLALSDDPGERAEVIARLRSQEIITDNQGQTLRAMPAALVKQELINRLHQMLNTRSAA